jgi:prepilin-type N-terminal cleavage/methylation domain-containing protein
MRQRHRGFTLIELLVVIAVIGLLATLAVVALSGTQARGRDAARVGAIRQIQTALELYNSEALGYPPTTGPVVLGIDGQRALCSDGWKAACDPGDAVYLTPVPKAAAPQDGGCDPGDNDFTYTAVGGANYTLTFCLGNVTGYLAPGMHTADPSGIR